MPNPNLPIPPVGGAPDVLDRPPAYLRLHPDISLNFQVNRWLAWMTPAALPDVTEIASRVHAYADFTRDFLQLGDRYAAKGRQLDAALCYRAAEFFLLPGDDRRAPARGRFLELIRSAYGVGPEYLATVPYDGAVLPAYRFGNPSRGTIVVHGGFDSYIEEFFPLMLAMARSGFQVLGFEGPGQGGALEDSGLLMTPEWHRPVGAVLDPFGLDRVTLLGISLGGCLAIRAAAFEPRVVRVIADDALSDFLACNLRQASAAAGVAVRALRALRAGRVLDGLVYRRMRRDLLTAWGISQGSHVLGARNPHEYFAALARYTTPDVSANLRADVLLMAGAEDHYVPPGQLVEQLRALARARSVTTRLFTRDEQAQNHCQVGNIPLSLRVMLDWLQGLEARDGRLGY